jgi:mono/diheme cytochrome c family protein
MERVLPKGRVLTVVAGALASGALLAACGSQAPSSSSDNLVAGKQLFVERCGSCHTMQRAGTKGTVGPNLDAAFRQSLSEGFERSVVRGVVSEQIKHPLRDGKMPADLVTGDNVTDVAAYVAESVDKKGEDTGLLATAVKAPGGGKPAVAKDGTLQINADPSGQLAYVTDKASAPPGRLTVKMGNESSVEHDIAIEGNGVNAKGEGVGKGGTSEFTVDDIVPGSDTDFCTVQGHRQAGMQGTLTVKWASGRGAAGPATSTVELPTHRDGNSTLAVRAQTRTHVPGGVRWGSARETAGGRRGRPPWCSVLRARRQLLGDEALMSASADSSSSATARSPIETMPTGRSPSTTGRRRTSCSRMSLAASCALWSGLTVMS